MKYILHQFSKTYQNFLTVLCVYNTQKIKEKDITVR